MARRWVLVAATAVVGFAILGVAPNYLEVQRAADAADFRVLVEETSESRLAVAAVLDLAFAVLYAATVAVWASGDRRYALGRWLVVLGAIFDEVENSFVLRGALDPDGLSDAMVTGMKRFGDLKAVALIAGVAALLVAAGRARSRGQPSKQA